MIDHHHMDLSDDFLPHGGDPQLRRLMSRRRMLVAGMLGAFSVYALIREARAAAPALGGRLAARQWIDRQEELARGLRSGAVSEESWHDEVNRLAGEVDIGSLIAEMKRARVKPAGEPFMRDPIKRKVRFRDENGMPMQLAYKAATFTFDPSNVITPHGHKHMASAHMVIDGKVRVRTFDRVGEKSDALIIRPTGDHIAGPGEAAAMTTAVDNIHWFTPETRSATTFDVIVSGLDPGQDAFLIQPVDPLGGEKQKDGTIVAPIMGFKESMDRYPPSR
ncbi:MAG: hypothetical protein AB7F74_19690 [Parvibaculaceae bacterium]